MNAVLDTSRLCMTRGEVVALVAMTYTGCTALLALVVASCCAMRLMVRWLFVCTVSMFVAVGLGYSVYIYIPLATTLFNQYIFNTNRYADFMDNIGKHCPQCTKWAEQWDLFR